MSEKVDDLLSKSNDIRNSLSYLQTLEFSNEELLEIFEKNEKKKDTTKGFFYSNLLRSQRGPFSTKVYATYKNSITDHDGWLALLRKTKGLNQAMKNAWIKKALQISAVMMEFLFEEFTIKRFGININKPPYNITVI